MPIEIRELVIRAIVQEEASDEAGDDAAEAIANDATEDGEEGDEAALAPRRVWASAEEQQAIIEAAVQQVLRILKAGKER